MSISTKLSECLGRKCHTVEYSVKLVSSSLSNILRTDALRHEWSSCEAAVNIIKQIDSYITDAETKLTYLDGRLIVPAEIGTFVLHANEELHYYDERATLGINKNLIIVLKTGEIGLVDISSCLKGVFLCDFHDYYCDRESEDHDISPKTYKIVGYKEEFIDGVEYVVDASTNKIVFERREESVIETAKYVPTRKSQKYIYLHNETDNTYHELTFSETFMGAHKRTLGKLGSYHTEDIQTLPEGITDLSSKNMSVDLILMCDSIQTELHASYYLNGDKSILFPLFDYSYDGNDDLYPCGYAKVYL